jgi:hypothetical protein
MGFQIGTTSHTVIKKGGEAASNMMKKSHFKLWL